MPQEPVTSMASDQQTTDCRFEMIMSGVAAIPRSCPSCGLGGCKKGLPDPWRKQSTPDRILPPASVGLTMPERVKPPRPRHDEVLAELVHLRLVIREAHEALVDGNDADAEAILRVAKRREPAT